MTMLQRRLFLKAAMVATVGTAISPSARAESTKPLTMIVMDPLAAPLSCPCVKGYAQRDYKQLAKYLEAKLNRSVVVFFGESLSNTLTKKSGGLADIIIGKESVVRIDSHESKLGMKPIAALTGKDGKTTMTGLVVVAAKDPALSAADLKGYSIIFGEANADEKHTAAVTLMNDLGVALPKKLETCVACTDGATKVVAAGKANQKVATVISSYAQPLLEGCGTIEKGDLRVIGETDPVPFVVAFVNEQLPTNLREAIQAALTGMASEKALLTAMESKEGFINLPAKKK